jgi:HEAT repeat protein
VSSQLLQELRRALGDRSNLLAAEAAEIAGNLALADLVPDLLAAFERFLIEPLKSDKLCRAKIAIAQALDKMEYTRQDVFLRGVTYVQPEPVWGGQQDTAAPLRAACAFALVRIGYGGVLDLLVDLLIDPQREARLAAVQSLAYSGSHAAGLLLRLKARVGDKEPDVTAECLSGLLKLDPEHAMPFVAEFFQSADEAVQELAALALGESRRPEAFQILEAFWQHHAHNRLRETILVALALLRLPAANDFLLSLVTSESPAVAAAAVSALAVHRHDPRLHERAAAAVAETGSAALRAQFEERFQTND